jgi:hypothetical protein
MASGYETRDREVGALTDALIGTLDDLRKADGTRVAKTVARLVADPDVRRVLERTLVTKHIPTRTFSPLAKGLQNNTTFAVTDGELTAPEGLPSAYAKRRARSGR